LVEAPGARDAGRVVLPRSSPQAFAHHHYGDFGIAGPAAPSKVFSLRVLLITVDVMDLDRSG